MEFKVCEGRSIKTPKGALLGPGEKLKTGDIQDSLIEEHINSGFLEIYQEPLVFTPQKAGNIGKWNKDPKVLKELNLEQLNVMILEIDGTIQPFETREEAIAKLSSDFK